MASNWADNQTTNGTVGGNGEVSPVVPESLIQVSEIGIFILWVLIQSLRQNLCWHLTGAFLQIIRIILMKRISKIILICNVIIISEGWSKILGVRGLIALTMTSVCKLCIDLSVMILEKDDFVFWCEMTIISINAVYLMGILMVKHRREACLWVVVGTITLSAFLLGGYLRNIEIILLGVLILTSRWDKMSKKIKQGVECCKSFTNVDSVRHIFT